MTAVGRLTAILGFALVIALLASAAQPATKVPRLCFVTFDPSTLEANRYGAFFGTLRDLGYVAGKTMTIDYLSAAGRVERFADVAATCVRRNADIIATTTTPAARAAKNATATIPIVMLISGDPLGAGLISSFARPGGNVTGQSFMAPGLAAKRLELLREAVPAISRVLVLTYPLDPISPPQVAELREASRRLGITLFVRDVRASEDLPHAFADGIKQRPEALTVTSESIFAFNRGRLVDLATQHRLPAVYPWRLAVEAGGLMSYGQNSDDLFSRAAVYVDRILKGAKPGDLPVEQPTRFELVLNVKAARTIGLVFPPSLLLRADRVIEQ